MNLKKLDVLMDQCHSVAEELVKDGYHVQKVSITGNSAVIWLRYSIRLEKKFDAITVQSKRLGRNNEQVRAARFNAVQLQWVKRKVVA
jgi:hypothetical protein